MQDNNDNNGNDIAAVQSQLDSAVSLLSVVDDVIAVALAQAQLSSAVSVVIARPRDRRTTVVQPVVTDAYAAARLRAGQYIER